MNAIKIITEGEECWPDIAEKIVNGDLIHLNNGNVIEFVLATNPRARLLLLLKMRRGL